MNKKCTDEQIVIDALSAIHADTTNLSSEVMKRLDEDVSIRKPIKMKRIIILAALITVLLMITVFAGLGGGEFFTGKLNPNPDNSDSVIIAEDADTQMLSDKDQKSTQPGTGICVEKKIACEDKGIRMEVLKAEKAGSVVTVQLLLQDVTGENRLTKTTCFRDGFTVRAADGEALSVNYSEKVVEFDKDTNSVYYEVKINMDDGELSDLKIGTFLMYFEKVDYDDVPLGIDLAKLPNTVTRNISLEHVWGGTYRDEDKDTFSKTLKPGYYASMPTGARDQWVSAVGLIGNKLHIQVAEEFGREFGSVFPLITLKDKNGERINSDYLIFLYGDKDTDFVPHGNGPDKFRYSYTEAVFTVNPERISDYVPHFTSSAYQGIDGKWEIVLDKEDIQ